MAYLILQSVVLGIAVLFSLWHVLNKVSPKTVQAVKTRMTGRAPEAAPKSCGTGCDSCGMCATIAALQKDVAKR